jgi:hypothetical protein
MPFSLIVDKAVNNYMLQKLGDAMWQATWAGTRRATLPAFIESENTEDVVQRYSRHTIHKINVNC